jgi:uncharacterized OB-fold protein
MLLGMRDKEEIWAVKCPSCKRVLFPPEIVCGMCKIRIEDKDENWIKLGNEGTVVNFLAHILEETDTTKLYPGVRVRAVWKPREERHGLMSDIKFWRIVEGEK